MNYFVVHGPCHGSRYLWLVQIIERGCYLKGRLFSFKSRIYSAYPKAYRDMKASRQAHSKDESWMFLWSISYDYFHNRKAYTTDILNLDSFSLCDVICWQVSRISTHRYAHRLCSHVGPYPSKNTLHRQFCPFFPRGDIFIWYQKSFARTFWNFELSGNRTRVLWNRETRL